MDTHEKIAKLLRAASIYGSDVARVEKLVEAEHLIINKCPALLDNFLDEILVFKTDRSTLVRRSVVRFIGDAVRCDNDCLPRVVDNFRRFLHDRDVHLVKMAIYVARYMYPVGLKWILRRRNSDETALMAWRKLQLVKDAILTLIDSLNDGVRVAVIKFMEMVCLVHHRSIVDQDQVAIGFVCFSQIDIINLDYVEADHPIINRAELIMEGAAIFDQLNTLARNRKISYVNSIAAIQAICSVAKSCPTGLLSGESFSETVMYRRNRLSLAVETFEFIWYDMHPNLTLSQIRVIRKTLTNEIMGLLCVPKAICCRQQLSQLLSALGVARSRVLEKLSVCQQDPEPDDDAIDVSKKSLDPSLSSSESSVSEIDLTAADIVKALSPTNVVEMIVANISKLPKDEQLPASFLGVYISSELTSVNEQKTKLARMLAVQLNTLGLGRGSRRVEKDREELMNKYEQSRKRRAESDEYPMDDIDDDFDDDAVDMEGVTFLRADPLPLHNPESRISQLTSLQAPEPEMIIKKMLMKEFRLVDVTKTLPYDDMNRMAMEAFRRVLNTEDTAKIFGGIALRRRILASLAVMFGQSFRDIYEEYIFSDLRHRTDLAINWIFQEYVRFNGMLKESGDCPNSAEMEADDSRYEDAVMRVLDTWPIFKTERPEQIRDRIFNRIVLCTPHFSELIMESFGKYCCDDASKCTSVLQTIKDLLVLRKPIRNQCVEVLMEMTGVPSREVRNCAIHLLISLHDEPELDDIDEILDRIESVSREKLMQLRNTTVTAKADSEIIRSKIEVFASLFLNLLIQKPALLIDMAKVFPLISNALVRQGFLDLIVEPVQCLDVQGPNIEEFVRNCPLTAYDLLSHVLTILSEEIDLPESVRVAIEKIAFTEAGVMDLRLVLPILSTVSIETADRFVGNVIDRADCVEETLKKAFVRLWRNKAYSALDLFVRLHSIPPMNTEFPHRLKNIMMATKVCFNRSNLYRDQVLLQALRYLAEMNEPPMLLMRSVIQTVKIHPNVTKDVITIIDNILIKKKLWQYPKLWEGFIKCCAQCQPHSIPLLFKIPSDELAKLFQKEKGLALGLWAYLNDTNLSDQERSKVPKEMLHAIYTLHAQQQAPTLLQQLSSSFNNARLFKTDSGASRR